MRRGGTVFSPPTLMNSSSREILSIFRLSGVDDEQAMSTMSRMLRGRIRQAQEKLAVCLVSRGRNHYVINLQPPFDVKWTRMSISPLSPHRVVFHHWTVGQIDDPSIINIPSYINQGLQKMQGILDYESVHDAGPNTTRSNCLLKALPFVSYTWPSTYSHICSCWVSSYTRFSNER
jgi:hypothetical protein